MKNHTQLLNHLAIVHRLNNYLEIGVNIKANNFDQIISKNKTGVDPKVSAQATYPITSDEFFAKYCNGKFDVFELIFIDGLHEKDQVRKDFENSLRVLVPGGFIVLHDCAPAFEVNCHFPRDKRGVWNGDVYKFICTLGEYDGIDFCTVDFDHGCTVVWKDESKKGSKRPEGEVDWQYYQNNKHLFRLESPQDFLKRW